MPKIKNGHLELTATGFIGLGAAKPAPFLTLKVRRMRRALDTALRDFEAVRQEYLDDHAQKDSAGKRKLKPRLANGKPVKDGEGELIMDVVFKNKKAYEEAYKALANTEVEFVEFITSEDIEDERHSKNFSVSADELDSLGPLFVDSADTKPKKKKAAPRKGKARSRGSNKGASAASN